MKYLFCGSRQLGDASQLKTAVRIVTSELKKMNASEDLIIHGGALGVDSLVSLIARDKNFRVTIVKPDYETDGRTAPLIRDVQMVNMADRVVAIWNGSSAGTLYTVNYAIMKQKPVRLHQFISEERYITLEPKSQIVKNK